ncbi:hypothetical protein DR85_1528 [Francisella tularensis]|nr:hypothetical protein DR85_1528 [Francisella tularensis]
MAGSKSPASTISVDIFFSAKAILALREYGQYFVVYNVTFIKYAFL